MRLVLLTAPWSTPGRLLEPVARKIAAEHGMALLCLDVDEHPTSIKRYGLRSPPELILEDGPAILGRWPGLFSEYELRRGIRGILQPRTIGQGGRMQGREREPGLV